MNTAKKSALAAKGGNVRSPDLATIVMLRIKRTAASGNAAAAFRLLGERRVWAVPDAQFQLGSLTVLQRGMSAPSPTATLLDVDYL